MGVPAEVMFALLCVASSPPRWNPAVMQRSGNVLDGRTRTLTASTQKVRALRQHAKWRRPQRAKPFSPLVSTTKDLTGPAPPLQHARA